MTLVYPFRCKPIYQKKVWGGRWFKETFGRELPDLDPYGESWELTCRSDAMSIVMDGEWMGKTFGELIQMVPMELLGQRVVKKGIAPFPLLIKFLDASDHLSIQVHPDDSYAQKKSTGELGKTEMWYVLDAEPGASLVLGLQNKVTRAELARRIDSEEILQCLNLVPVKAGDVFFIPAGTVHAVLKGIRLAEIQQNSDTTYRIHDWGRKGLDGKPRDLHIADALEVIDFQQGKVGAIKGVEIQEDGYRSKLMVACPHFAVEELVITSLKGRIPPERFEVWMVIAGSAVLETAMGKYLLTMGDTWMVPAQLGEFQIQGDVKILKTYIPDVEKEIILPLRERGFADTDLQNIGGL